MSSRPTGRKLLLPPPDDLGAPERFTEWRNGQDEGVAAALHTDKRFVGLVYPTGVGKSLALAVIARFLKRPAVVLTSTRGLQDQYMRDYGPAFPDGVGMLDVRGMSNYPCRALQQPAEAAHILRRRKQDDGSWSSVWEPNPDMSELKAAAFNWRVTHHGSVPMCDDGPCLDGIRCGLKTAGCHYFDAVSRARLSKLFVTNYAWWFTRNLAAIKAEEDAGGDYKGVDVAATRKLLLCDEAHDIPDALCSHLRVTIDSWEVEILAKLRWPSNPSQLDQAHWSTWAKAALATLEARRASNRGGKLGKKLRELVWRFQRLASIDSSWIMTQRGSAWSWEPTWPAPFAEDMLFAGIDKVVMASATMRPKTLELLGVQAKDVEWVEVPSPFPVARRPIIASIGAGRLSQKNSWDQWVPTINNILRRRLDRKGIIHTVSYDRAKMLVEKSRFRDYMILHDSKGTKNAVAEFKAAKPPCYLVSPSITTGYDFPGDECRLVIVGKLPFPTVTDPVTAARSAQDKTYTSFKVATTLVQMAGRGMRAEGDWCEVIIVDEQVLWFVKPDKAGVFLPRWFHDAYRVEKLLPAPLEVE